ncbi:MAG TPA: serine hydrolase domain-containing protein, partial [Cytophagaceae bacterium]|nr:serine hydrolase domain-containing protein [Cytophagaceae bacterium]
MNNKLIFTFLIGFIIQTGFSQTFDKAKLDNYFQALENNNKFMGSVAVSQNGKLIYTKSVGYADIETNTKANENSKYRIGSISKTFTTVLILKATEEHKLDLTQTIDKYFPTVTNASKITISQLLYHRSGIPNFTNDKSYLNWNTQSKKESEMLEIVVKSGSDFEPDSKAEYSNSNFLLLSYILEKVYKKNYSKVLEDKIIKPLGLQNTFFGGKINLKNNECYSYKFLANWNKETETDLSIPMGAGAIVSTPTDLTIFSTALFEGK